jgi:hypothetical protein
MKAQADIISSVIIIIIAIGLVSTAYMWGMPLIQKRQDSALVDRAYGFFDRNNFNSLVKKIEYVAKNGGEDTFTLDISGIWILYPCPSSDGLGCSCGAAEPCNSENNSIQFSFPSRASNIAVNSNWVPINSPNPSYFGTLGIDDVSVVLAKSESAGDGFNITYKLWFRELNESLNIGYKVDIMPSGTPGITTSVGKSLRISNAGTSTITTSGGKTLIITEIKIFLI